MKNTTKRNRKEYFAGHSVVWLTNEIHKSAKVKAAQEGISLKSLIEKTVNLYLKNTLPTQ